MSATRNITASLIGLVLSSTLVLGLTLAVYSTILNPGLPILLGGLFTGLWCLFRLFRGSNVYYNWGLEVSILLLLWMALATIFSLDAYMAQKSLATFIGGVGFILAPQCAISSGRHWRVYAHGFLLLVVAACVSAWVIAFQDVSEGTIPALTGTFNNPDAFSVLPMLAFLLGLGLLERGNRFWRNFLHLELGLFGVTLFATGCRAAMLGCLVGSIGFVLTLVFQRSSHLKKIKPLLIVPFAALMLVLPLANFGLSVTDKLTQTLTALDREEQITRSEVFWRSPVAVANHPLLGAGPGCFGFSFQSVREADHDELVVNIAHNDHFEMAVELGVVGFLLWLLLIATSVQTPLALIKDGRRPLAASAAVAAISGAVVFQFFNFIVSERPAFWCLCWVIGLALSFPSSRSRLTEPTLARFGGTLLVLAGAIWAVIFGYRAVRADELARRAADLAETLKIEAAVQGIDKAIEYQPNSTELRLNRVALSRTLARYTKDDRHQVAALRHLEAARAASPASIPVLLALADHHRESQAYPQARETLKIAREYAPYHHDVLRKQASLGIQDGHLVEASEILAIKKVVGDTRRVQMLVPLLQTIESKEPGRGVALLKKWRNEASTDWTKELTERLIFKSAKSKHWNLAVKFAELKLSDPNAELCAHTQIAIFKGKLEDSETEWRELNGTLAGTEPNRTQCYAMLLNRWTQTGVALGRADLVEAKLADILKEDKRHLPARLNLSKTLSKSGKRKEALTIARKGLEFHERSAPLVIHLAELYERQGSTALALTYYKDASRLDPKNQELQSKLKALSKKR